MVAGTNQSPFIVSWPVGRRAGAQGFGTQRQGQPLRKRRAPGRAALPTQSAERDMGQGSAGFSSFDGHGTRFDMVRGLVFILFLFFFFLF